MKITEAKLRQLIKEEIKGTVDEISLPFFRRGPKSSPDTKKGKTQVTDKLRDLSDKVSMKGALDLIAQLGQSNPEMEEKLLPVARTVKQLQKTLQPLVDRVNSLNPAMAESKSLSFIKKLIEEEIRNYKVNS